MKAVPFEGRQRMTRQSDEECQAEREILGVWEEAWREQAARARKVQRYRRWLRAHGASRDEAAKRAVRALIAHHQRWPIR